MKDAFFRWWQRLSNLVYVLVTGFTYYVFSHKRYDGAPGLSGDEKAKIRQFWKKNYGKTVPMYQYAWLKSKGYDPDPRYIPDTFWHTKVEPAYTNLQMEKGFSDKNYFETIVGKEHSPETLCRCINGQLLDGEYAPVDLETICRTLREEPEIICKPSIDSGGGRNIRFLRSEEVTAEQLRALMEEYQGNFVVQKILKQHAFMQRLNPNSLNTMRIVTFLFQGEVHLLYAGSRIGTPESRVDNTVAGGVYVQLHKDGTMMDFAFWEDRETHELLKLPKLPNGLEFANAKIPYWQEIMDLLRKLHYKLPHFHIIHWDVAIREDGTPIIVEYNLIDSTPFPDQLGNGPTFGDLTEAVLQDLAARKNRNHGKN